MFKNTNRLKLLMLITWLAFISLVLTAVLLVRWYNLNLKPVDRQITDEQTFVVVRGETADQIATKLEEAQLIRDASAFKWYVRFNNQEDELGHGTFNLSPSFYVSKIVRILSSGVPANLKVTILPEHNLIKLHDSLVNQGFSSQDIHEAFQLDHYKNHNLVKTGIIPRDASLEGYIAPETFAVDQFNANSAKDIIQHSLDQFDSQYLNTEIRTQLLENFDTLHEAVILASIVELEAPPEHRSQVAQVFLKRLQSGMRLDSDVTFFYAAHVGDYAADVEDPSPYNTRLHKGLPPGPISNISRSSLQAVANPADTDYLYFVVGDDGTMYFNETLEGHQSDAQRYCQKLCQLPQE